jgi:hypothetical protein
MMSGRPLSAASHSLTKHPAPFHPVASTASTASPLAMHIFLSNTWRYISFL